MKQSILIIIIIVLAILSASAHLGDQFYSPSKDWKPIKGFQFEEKNYLIKSKAINSIFFKTESTPKAKIFFYYEANGNISLNTGLIKIIIKEKYQIFTLNFRSFGKFKLVKTKTKLIWKYVNISHNRCKIF